MTVSDTAVGAATARRPRIAGTTKLYVAEGFSVAGDGIAWVAIVVTLADEPRFEMWLTLAVLARLGPRAVLGLASGSVVHRCDIRSLLVVTSLVRAAVMVALGIVAAFGEFPAVIVAALLVSSLIGVPTAPALAVAMPRVAGERHLAHATARLSTIRQLMTFVGPGVGVAVVALSPSLGFAVNGVTFLIAAGLFAATAELRSRVTRTGGRRSDRSRRRATFLHPFVDGIAAVRSVPEMPKLVALISTMYFVRGAELVLHVLVVRELLMADVGVIGYLGAAVGLGAIVAIPVVSRDLMFERPVTALGVACVLTAVPTAALVLTTAVVEAVVLLVVVGFAMVLFEVVSVVTIQRSTPRPALAGVFGALNGASNTGRLAGAIIAPGLVVAFDVSGALLVSAILLLGVMALTARPLTRVGRLASARRHSLDPVMNVLSSLALFEGMPARSLERVAAMVHEEEVPHGTVLIREGDEPDELFVIRAGEFDVTVEGRNVNAVHPGDWCGEIGLVDGIPRTATVRATTDAVVWRIPGVDFLAALEDAGAPPSALVQGIADRLAIGARL